MRETRRDTKWLAGMFVIAFFLGASGAVQAGNLYAVSGSGYDARGALRRRVTRPVDYLRRPGFAALDEQYLGVALGGLAAPIVLDSGYWLVLAAWPTNVDDPNALAETPAAQRPEIVWASSLDLFDPEGRFLYSLHTPGSQSPEIGRPWAVGPHGRLYTVVADPFPQVRRYRVILQPPAPN